jgi:hypothetical protein
MKASRAEEMWHHGHTLFKKASMTLSSAPTIEERKDVCKRSKRSMKLFLQSFLTAHDVPFQENQTIDTLIQRCSEVDSRFKEVVMDEINCRFEELTSEC